MLQTIFIVAALYPSSGVDAGTRFALTESTRSDTTKTVTTQMTSSMTEECTSVQSQWRFEAEIPFSAAEWTELGHDGTVSAKIGNQLIEEKISANDGFNPKASSYVFKLTRPVFASRGFVYLTLPTDKPALPSPPSGTRLVYGKGSLEFNGATLKIIFSTAGRSRLSLAGENFVAVENGSFEGKLPVELTAGTQRRESELIIEGTAKHKDIRKDGSNGAIVVGRAIQLSLTGKSS
jgi:hypothetical protein